MGKIYLSQNLRHLRKIDSRKPTQSDMAVLLGVSISTYGAYEEGRAEPKLENLRKITGFFGIEIDELLSVDLKSAVAAGEESSRKAVKAPEQKENPLRVLTVTVDSNGTDNIEWVPVKAAAGYTAGFGDPEFVSSLPAFQLPFLDKRRKYRAFTIQGDSMLPISSGSMIFAEYVDEWKSIKDNTACILVTASDGIVFKKVFNYLSSQNCFLLVSTNRQYDPYVLGVDDVLEIWKFSGFYSAEFPEEIRN